MKLLLAIWFAAPVLASADVYDDIQEREQLIVGVSVFAPWTYTDRNGNPQRPYIIHRAPLSTHERFISFLIEFYGGAFPTWMTPNQVTIVPVGEHVADYADEISELLTGKMIRNEVDHSSAGFGKRVRNAIVSKTPNIWIIGGDEAEARSITWRRYAVKDQPTLPLDNAIDALLAMRDQRLMDNFADVDIPS